MQQRNLRVRSSLPLGNGAVSCDMLVTHKTDGSGSRLRCVFATTEARAIQLYHLAPMTVDTETTKEEMFGRINWANNNIKHPHIRKNCHIANTGGGTADELVDVVNNLHMLHESAATDGCSPVLADLVSLGHFSNAFRVGKESSGSVTELYPHGDDVLPESPVYVCAWTTECNLDGRLSLPMPVAKVEGVTVNTTVMLLGTALRNCFMNTAFNVDVAPTEIGASPEVCNILYIPPMEMRLTHGMHSAISDEDSGYVRNASSQSGRTYYGFNGVTCRDETRQRLMVFADDQYTTVPLLCGCAIRDNKRFERAHVPIIFAPSSGLEYIFSDNPDGRVLLTIDGTVWGAIDPTRRERFDSVLWVEGDF